MKPALAELLHNPLVWRGDSMARLERAVPTGFPDLDRVLPGGGWPQGALTELLSEEQGIGELRLILPTLARLAQASQGIVLVAPPHRPYAPAFAAAGIDPARVIVVPVGEDKHRWWAAEQVLRADSEGGVLLWPASMNEQRLRRLQLAAQGGETLAFVFATTARAVQPSPSPLRLRLSPAGERLRVDVLKRRGGVVSAPLLLDVQSGVQSGTDPDSNRGLSPVRLPVRPAAPRPLSFNRRYPVGGREARIWNRALVRADEVRRMPGPDPRGSCCGS